MMQGAKGEEKRQVPRMPVEWTVRARLMGVDDELEGLRSFDISKSGLGLELKQPIERDTVVKVEFAPGEGQPEVHAYAFVAWSAANGKAGLKFFGIGEDDENRLADLVERFVLGRSRMRAAH